jgi:hypothetical protein
MLLGLQYGVIAIKHFVHAEAQNPQRFKISALRTLRLCVKT